MNLRDTTHPITITHAYRGPNMGLLCTIIHLTLKATYMVGGCFIIPILQNWKLRLNETYAVTQPGLLVEPGFRPRLPTGSMTYHKNKDSRLYIERKGKKPESPTSLDWVAGKMVMSVVLLNISVAS